MKDNDKDDNNNKYKNNGKGISALGLDRDLVFSRGKPPDDHNEEVPDIPLSSLSSLLLPSSLLLFSTLLSSSLLSSP